MDSSNEILATVPDGCNQCPNRNSVSDRSRGKWGAYLFAGVLIIFALIFSIERAPDGNYQRSTEPPVLVWGLLFPLIAACLGVQVDPEQIGHAIARATQK